MELDVTTIASTTDSQAAVDASARAGDDWKVPPAEGEPSPEEKAASEQAKLEQKEGETRPLHPGKNGWQRRVDKLTARSKSAEARAESAEAAHSAQKERADRLEQELREIRAQSENGNRAQPEAETPNEETQQEGAENTENEPQENESQVFSPEYDRSAKRTAQRTPDYDAVFDKAEADGLAIPTAAHSRIQELPNGGDVAYFLASNPSLARELNKLSQQDSVTAVNRISADLAGVETQAQFQHSDSYRQKMQAVHATLTPADLAALRKVGDLPIQLHTWRAVQSLDNGPQVALYLARHPDVTRGLVNMAPESAVAQVGRLSARLEAPPPTRTSPPPPIRKVTGGQVNEPRQLDDPEVSMREYISRRNKQEAEWKGRRRTLR
jgi:hypothetical protein